MANVRNKFSVTADFDSVPLVGTTSDVLALEGQAFPVGFSTPASWTTGNVTFLVDVGDGSYKLLVNADGTVQHSSVAPSRVIALNPNDFLAVKKIKFVSSVTQTTGVALGVVTQPR